MLGSPLSARRSAFTLIELLVVVAIIAILIAVLIPGMAATKQISQRIKCQSNLSQIAKIMHTYGADEKDQIFPGGTRQPGVAGVDQETYATILVAKEYLSAPALSTIGSVPVTSSVFYCPSGMSDSPSDRQPTSATDSMGFRPWRIASAVVKPGLVVDTWYGVNGSTTGNFTAFQNSPFRRIPNDWDDADFTLCKISRVANPNKMAALFDGVFMNLSTRVYRVSARHGSDKTEINMAFIDGHVGILKTTERPTANGADYVTPTTLNSQWTAAQWRLDQ